MRVIIAGSRDYKEPLYYLILQRAIVLSGFKITEVVSGHASGIDTWGEYWSREYLRKEAKIFKAKWYKNGVLDRSAGPIRNQEMADYVGPEGGLIAIPGKGNGTRGMIKIAEKMGIKTFIYEL